MGGFSSRDMQNLVGPGVGCAEPGVWIKGGWV